MARKSVGPPEPKDIREFRTVSEVDSGIQKLNRRIAEIQPLVATPDTDAADSVQHRVRDTVREVFGADSPQFERFRYFKIDESPTYARGDWGDGGYDYDADKRRQLVEEAPKAVKRIQVELLGKLNEIREDLHGPEAAPRAALSGRSLNPAIGAAATALFRDGHYSEAVFKASRALIDLVKAKSGRSEDGADLMDRVFSRNNPVLAFSSLTSDSEKDEQLGMMHLYKGAVIGIRNPAAHTAEMEITADRALQYLEFLGMLADRLDEATKRP